MATFWEPSLHKSLGRTRGWSKSEDFTCAAAAQDFVPRSIREFGLSSAVPWRPPGLCRYEVSTPEKTSPDQALRWVLAPDQTTRSHEDRSHSPSACFFAMPGHTCQPQLPCSDIKSVSSARVLDFKDRQPLSTRRCLWLPATLGSANTSGLRVRDGLPVFKGGRDNHKQALVPWWARPCSRVI